MLVEPPYAPPYDFRPSHLRRTRLEVEAEQEAAIGKALSQLFVGLCCLLVAALLIKFLGVYTWALIAGVLMLARLVETLLVLGMIFGVAFIPRAIEWVAGMPDVAALWPLMLAAAVPIPIALLVNRVFFRR